MTASARLLLIAVVLCASTRAIAAAPPETAAGEHGMVVSAQHEASEAGLRILKAGGNAIDAAVAVGYALAVVDPCCGNIGGGGFMLVHTADGHDSVINFRETAPHAATAGMFLDRDGNPLRERSLYGYLAAGVPGTVMGLDRALSEYGKLGRAAVMAPAIGLARDGFVLGEADAAIVAARADRLAKDPEAARIFLREDSNPYRAGDRLVQTDLAKTLALVAEHGPEAFYRGSIAAAVAAASNAQGGFLTEQDFADYTVTEAPPITCSYRGYTIFSAPPPSSGGPILCEMLNVLSGWDLASSGQGSAATIHLMAETMRHTYVDRNTLLGDPAFVNNSVPRLLSPGYAAAIRAVIDPDKATASSALGPGAPPHERAETTHYSVADGEGNLVAVTYTLNGFFGAAVVAPGTGFLLNNEMDDFTVKPGAPNLFGLVQGAANAIAPGKRPLSSMTPTIVENDGRPVLVLGSPGGPRITTAVLETLTNIVDFGIAPDQAVRMPRFHHQWLPDVLYYERGGLPPATVAALAERGYRLVEQSPWGAVELIAIGPGGHLFGVSDLRRPAGAALGY
ncbi:MAG: gamma-glutamyltransferase [Alphaproteobacteria bacterium]|nr:gamma-glutamyltransferase [Alphaproteobacteria bacterium]